MKPLTSNGKWIHTIQLYNVTKLISIIIQLKTNYVESTSFVASFSFKFFPILLHCRCIGKNSNEKNAMAFKYLWPNCVK